MNSTLFIRKWREAFGEKPELPIAFGYSEQPMSQPQRRGHCLINALRQAREGEVLTFSADEMECRGGLTYTGFSKINEKIPAFVSQTEHYKLTPDLVVEAVHAMDLQPAPAPYISFWRIDRMDDMDSTEGLICFVRPDVLSGLVGWASYDNAWKDAVMSGWGSGCSSIVANVMTENHRKGHSCFIGMFDISARPYVAPDELTFSIPMSRLSQMIETMDQCFLHKSKAWEKVKTRINE